MENYTVYHLHSDRSLLDSCTNYKDYIDKAVELGMTSIGFSEHGNIYNWIEKKMYCDKKGIKYLHGCEVYITETFNEKIRDNMHTILIAKNMEGLKELNLLIDLSTTDSHTYYKNRISIAEFLNISDNIIKLSACLASPLNKLNENNEVYESIVKKYDYLEIQYHNDKDGWQSKYNQKLYELSKKYNKPLIVGTDTHSINKYKSECRSILKKAKKMMYDNEDDFDLTFKSYSELIKMFKIQNSLPLDVVMMAIENTNKMSQSCEEIILDTKVKYPALSNNDEELFVKTLQREFKLKVDKGVIEDTREFRDNLNEEIRVFKKLNMCSFMLFMSELCVFCKENGIPIGFCRGSVGGSCVAYLLGIIDLNPVKWKTVFSRFANEDRVEVGDIDLDFSPDQRQLVYEYIINKFGNDKSAYILAIGTISDKGTIDDVGRALEIPLNEVSEIKKLYEENPEKAKSKYPKLFYYFDGLLGTAISQSMHPAGIIASPVTLHDNYGTFWKDGSRILQINMEEVHDGAGLVKYDILGLKNIQIIRNTCDLLNCTYPNSHEIDWNDKEVWGNITKSPVGLFQFESKFAYDCLKRFNPSSVNDLAMLSAILRPGANSIRERFLNREFNKNPDVMIDELFKANNGWLIFQEDTIAFLQQICGLSGSEADNIRRAIGRKQEDRLNKAMPQILDGYCSNSEKERSVAEEEAKIFLEILSDSASYQFGKNHSTGYSMITYLCAYYRQKHPLEFVTAYLNLGNEEDIINATQLANELNIKINNPAFGKAKGKYFPHSETNSIYKGVGSIKYLNETVGDELYRLSKNKFSSFTELLIALEDISINSRQLEILIKLGYFKEFGKTAKLLKLVEIFNTIYPKKQFNKSKLPLGITEEEFRKYSDIETKTMFKEVKKDLLISNLENLIYNSDLPLQTLLDNELEFLGYIQYKNPDIDRRYVLITNVNDKYTPVVDTYSLASGISVKCKISRRIWDELEKGNIIYINSMEQKFGFKKIGDDEKGKAIFEKDTNKLEWHIKDYSVINSMIDNVLEELNDRKAN